VGQKSNLGDISGRPTPDRRPRTDQFMVVNKSYPQKCLTNKSCPQKRLGEPRAHITAATMYIMDQRFDDVFTRAEARAAGHSDGQLRGARFAGVLQGVHTTGNPSDIMIRAKAALCVCPPGALLGGATVLRLLGAWLPETLLADEKTYVTVQPGEHGPEHRQIVVTRCVVPLPPVEFMDGVYGVHPAQAWFQIACRVHITDLVVAVDSLLRRQHTLAVRSEMELIVARFPGRRGVRRAHQALAMACAGVDSPMETRLRLAMISAGLPPPVVNFEVVLANGHHYFLDMAYPDVKLAVEYDGAVHVANRRQMEADQTRRRELEDAGWRILTVTAADFTNLDGVMASIRRALVQRGAQG